MIRCRLEDYMLLTLKERQAHLNLNEPCDEFGTTHTEYRPVLALFLRTTCTKMGRKTGIACHACNNRKCANPRHLYWGTSKENAADLDRVSSRSEKSKKSAEKRKEIDPDCFRMIAKESYRVGSKPWNYGQRGSKDWDSLFAEVEESGINIYKYGWVGKVAKLWNVSHTEVRRAYRDFWKGPKPYERNKLPV